MVVESLSQEFCGPEATSWYARQLDLVRSKSDYAWILIPDAFDALMAPLPVSQSGVNSFGAILVNNTPTTSSCPSASCSHTLTVCNKCFSASTLSHVAFGYFVF